MSEAQTSWTGGEQTEFAGVGASANNAAQPAAAEPPNIAPDGSRFPTELLDLVRTTPLERVHIGIIEGLIGDQSGIWDGTDLTYFSSICDLTATTLCVAAVGLEAYEALKSRLPLIAGKRTFASPEADNQNAYVAAPAGGHRWFYVYKDAGDDAREQAHAALREWGENAPVGSVAQLKLQFHGGGTHTFVLERHTETLGQVLMHQAYEGVYSLRSIPVDLAAFIETLQRGWARDFTLNDMGQWLSPNGINEAGLLRYFDPTVRPGKARGLDAIGGLLFSAAIAPGQYLNNRTEFATAPVVAAELFNQEQGPQTTPYPEVRLPG